jgi:hypothetical protein
MNRKLKELFQILFDPGAAKTLSLNLLNAAVLFAVFFGLLAFILPALDRPESCYLPLYERQNGTICPEALHVVIREGFFERQHCVIHIRSDAEFRQDDLSVELSEHSLKYVQSKAKIGDIFEIEPDDPEKRETVHYMIDFYLADSPRDGLWPAPPENISFAIRLNPDAVKDISKVRLFCPGVAREDIACAEYDYTHRNPAPQVESFIWNIGGGGARIKLKPGSVYLEDIKPDLLRSGKDQLIELAWLLLAALFQAYFKWAPTGPDGPGTMRAFGKGFALFFVGVVLVHMLNSMTGLTILGLEIQARAGTLPLPGLTVLHWCMSLMLFAGVVICAILAVRTVIRRLRLGAAVRLSVLPALYLIAVACLTVRAQYARHYAREQFRAGVTDGDVETKYGYTLPPEEE